MNRVLIILQVLYSTQVPVSGSLLSLPRYLSRNEADNFANRSPESTIHHLQKDVPISTTIQVRSEKLSLVGNNSSLLFNLDIIQCSTLHVQSSEQRCNGPAAPPQFMFDVSNSTFSVKGIHANCKSGRNGLCSISASQVRFSSSSICSNGLSSPFMIRTFDSEAFQSGSSIPLLGVTHLSNTHALPPLAGLLHPSTMLSSAFNSDLNDISLDIDAGVSVVGMGLVLASTSFLAGTGPLLSFGLSEDQPLPDVVHSQRMETMLIGCKLMNVTSRRVGRREEVMVGREVSQQLIGSAVCRSVNHASGTGMMDGNLGGNVRCVNTSFRECRREGNSDPSFFNTNMTQTATGRQVFDASCTATLVSYSLCTFTNMVLAVAGSLGGALQARLEEHCRLAWRSIAGSLGGALQARLEEQR